MLTTPNSFLVVSAQGLVQLTWTGSPNATSYNIFRSADGVSFSQVGTTTLNLYQDVTPVPPAAIVPPLINTTYYYFVQAFDGTNTSQSTPTLSGQSLLPGQTTVGNIRLQAQQRCDRVNSNFITQQEWNSYINESYKELYDILIQKFGNDYFMAIPYTYTTSGTVDPVSKASLYPLPPDFYKLMGTEVALNPTDPNSWVTLKKFEFIQRNLWNFPNVYTFYGVTNLRYRLNGNNLMLVPIPSSGQTVRIWYAPRPNQLLNDTDLLDMVSGWEEYIIADICIKAMAKEESDVSVFNTQKAALMVRIEQAAENRDVGEPEVVSDSKTRNFAWSDDNGGSGNGMW
jgi:hypothetical protein